MIKTAPILISTNTTLPPSVHWLSAFVHIQDFLLLLSFEIRCIFNYRETGTDFVLPKKFNKLILNIIAQVCHKLF